MWRQLSAAKPGLPPSRAIPRFISSLEVMYLTLESLAECVRARDTAHTAARRNPRIHRGHTHRGQGTVHVTRHTRRARARRAGDAPRGREFGVVRCLGRVRFHLWCVDLCAVDGVRGQTGGGHAARVSAPG